MWLCVFRHITNGFSKKLENHVAALALYFMYYNFVRIHQTLRVTPAMAGRCHQQALGFPRKDKHTNEPI